jgi:NADPH:quinone reductase-like Zn-dependent oxidoreductase
LRNIKAVSVSRVQQTAGRKARPQMAKRLSGESILIHAGSGGVGLAAIQIAQHLSLEIFATAGTPEKRQLLKSMGVPHVMNSRTLDFADEVMAATNGRGVDAVLNSLAGDFIPKSLSVLAPFGRFLEIGKVDIYRNSKIGLQRLRDNISYFVIDLTQHLQHKPDFVVRMFEEIARRFEHGDYQPIAYTAFPVADAVEAFILHRVWRTVSAGCNIPDYRRCRRIRTRNREMDCPRRGSAPGADEPLRSKRRCRRDRH